MPAPPRSSLALAADKLARMVALSETFATGQPYPLARARVHRREALGSDARPFAVVSQGDKHDLELIGGGGRNFLRGNGQLFLYLARDTPVEFYDDLVQAEDDAANYFGEIVEQIAELAAADDPGSSDGTSHLSIIRISRVAFDENNDSTWEELGRFYFAGYLIDWGDGTS